MSVSTSYKLRYKLRYKLKDKSRDSGLKRRFPQLRWAVDAPVYRLAQLGLSFRMYHCVPVAGGVAASGLKKNTATFSTTR